jgi:hypothetical protein
MVKYALMDNMILRKETQKEFGKLIYDLAKIGFAIMILTPFAKGDNVSLLAFAIMVFAVVAWTYIINRGAKDE